MSRTTAQLERSDQGGAYTTPPLASCLECGFYNTPATPICFDCGKQLAGERPSAKTAGPERLALDTNDHKALNDLSKTIILLSLLFVVSILGYKLPWIMFICLPFIFLGGVVVMIIRMKNKRTAKASLTEAERSQRNNLAAQQRVQLQQGTTHAVGTAEGVLQIAEAHAAHAKESADRELIKINNLLQASDLDWEEREALSSSRLALSSQWERAEIALTEVNFTRWQNRVQGTIAGIIQPEGEDIYPEAGRKQLQFLKDAGREIKIGAEVMAEAGSGVRDMSVLERAREVCAAVDSLLETLNKCDGMLRRIEVVRAVRDASASIADGTRVVSLAASRTEEERAAAAIALDLQRSDFLNTDLLIERWKLDELSESTQRQESYL